MPALRSAVPTRSVTRTLLGVPFPLLWVELLVGGKQHPRRTASLSADERLADEQKAALIAVYRSMLPS